MHVYKLDYSTTCYMKQFAEQKTKYRSIASIVQWVLNLIHQYISRTEQNLLWKGIYMYAFIVSIGPTAHPSLLKCAAVHMVVQMFWYKWFMCQGVILRTVQFFDRSVAQILLTLLRMMKMWNNHESNWGFSITSDPLQMIIIHIRQIQCFNNSCIYQSTIVQVYLSNTN